MSKSRELAELGDVVTVDSGSVGIGTTNPSTFTQIPAKDLVVGGGADNHGLTIYSGTTSAGTLAFADGTSGDGEYRGFLQYHHNGDYMRFFTAASERMRIDSSGNLLVGKTSANLDTEGAELRSNGIVGGTVSGGAALWLNRTTSDGAIAMFSKDGATVGSIQASGTNMVVGNNGNVCVNFVDGTPDRIQPANSNRTSRDAAIDLGHSAARFKDLYLSGGVYLGGTGSANYLEDYEEGTWTPQIAGGTTDGTTSYVLRDAVYTKVGRLVTASAFIIWNSGTGTGGLRIKGLPFASSGGVYGAVTVGYPHTISLSANHYIAGGYVNNGDTQILVIEAPVGGGNANNIAFDAAGEIMITATYHTS